MRPSSDDTDTVDGSHPNPQTSSTSVNFTFVNLAEDIVSLCHRRISNKEQRHTIRSHVMQRVRQVESAQGKKRLTGREHSKRPSNPKSRRKSIDSEPSSNSEAKDKTRNGSVAGSERDKLSLAHSPHSSPRLNVSPAVHQFDPFDTLPTNQLPHASSESLLSYCFDVMLPITFCVETNNTRVRLARQGLVLSSKISNPASFLGFLAVTAAHRAVMWGRHKDLAPSNENHDDLILDPDYIRVKHEAMVAVRQTLVRGAVDERMLEACFGLISTATVAGNFEEAKWHLNTVTYITSQLELSEETLMWLPISNVKVSVGLLERPVMPLLFPREPIPPEVLQRITPAPATEIARLGLDFIQLHDLSDTLKSLLFSHRNICHMCEINAADPRSSSPLEMATLRNKATALEFDLLAYPFDNDDFIRDRQNEPQIPALEGVIRLAALGMLSVAPHMIMAATGNGRALTHHQKRATEKWLQGRQPWDVEILRLLTWALFVFVQNSLKQPEEAYFTNLLAQVARELWLSTWEDVEKVIYGYLFIPGIQLSTWKTIWADVCRTRAQANPQYGSR